MRMPTITISTNQIIQVCLGVAHILNLAMPQIPDKYKVPAAAVLAICNWAVSTMGHYSTPDGKRV